MKTASGKRPAAKADSTRQREAACGAVLDALRRTLGASGDEWEAARAAEAALALYCTGPSVFRVVIGDTSPRREARGFIG